MKSRSVRKNVKAFMLSHGININSPLSLSLLPVCPSYSPLLYPFPFSIVSLAPWLGSLSISFLSLAALCLLLDCLNVCLCLCARVLTRETEGGRGWRQRGSSSEFVLTHAFVCSSVCVRAGAPAGRARQGAGQTDGKREGEKKKKIGEIR